MSKKRKSDQVVIDINFALREVAQLLTIASDTAASKKNVNSMLNVSIAWAEFGKLLYDLSGGGCSESHESEPAEPASFGFGDYKIAEQEPEYEIEEE